MRAMLAGAAEGKRSVADPDVGSSRAGIDFIRAADNHVGAEYYINVTNTSPDYDADDAVLGFFTPPGAGMYGIPLQSLFGFERVHVKGGQTIEVYIAAKATDFTRVPEDGSRVAWEGIGAQAIHTTQLDCHGYF